MAGDTTGIYRLLFLPTVFRRFGAALAIRKWRFTQVVKAFIRRSARMRARGFNGFIERRGTR
jgi:hypothetical protein